jgi:hypothetical protein
MIGIERIGSVITIDRNAEPLADPKKFAHIRQELGIDSEPEAPQE